MKQILKLNPVFVIVLILTICFPVIVHAQDPGPDPDVPIDGGLSLLIAAGVGYGVRRVTRKKQKTIG